MDDLIKRLIDELYHLPTATDEQAATCMDAADVLYALIGVTPVDPSERVAAALTPPGTALEQAERIMERHFTADRKDAPFYGNLVRDIAAAIALALAPAPGDAREVMLPDPDPSALIVRLVQLSKPPYDSGVFGGPMAKAAAMLTAQAETIAALLAHSQAAVARERALVEALSDIMLYVVDEHNADPAEACIRHWWQHHAEALKNVPRPGSPERDELLKRRAAAIESRA